MLKYSITAELSDLGLGDVFQAEGFAGLMRVTSCKENGSLTVVNSATGKRHTLTKLNTTKRA